MPPFRKGGGRGDFLMKNLWSIRMRASQTVVTTSITHGRSASGSKKEIHISGAEGLYGPSDIQRVIKKYTERALAHPKGKADKIVITVENVKQKPKEIPGLPIATVTCRTPAEGKKIVIKLLESLGISRKALEAALETIQKSTMRGAAIITAGKGNRLEPDRERGVRISRLGISKQASRLLSSGLSRIEINTDTVKEALILASKVIAHGDVIAELCVSDDPHYTTGYIASKKLGYVRIPNIKSRGSRTGGRAFFVKEGIMVEKLINYLEKTPVIITSISPCRGTFFIDEVVNNPHK